MDTYSLTVQQVLITAILFSTACSDNAVVVGNCDTLRTCSDLTALECGEADDGCGGTIDLVADCGAAGCDAGETCGGGGTANVCGAGTCAPLTCSDFPGAECGAVSDGCSGTLSLTMDCGAAGCTAPETCNGGGAGETTCGMGPCVPSTCANFATAECGTVADGCGGTIDVVAECGASGCSGLDTCGGGGVSNECGQPTCTPLECADFPGAECGVVDNGCGGTINLVADCASVSGCSAPEVCATWEDPPVVCRDPCPSRQDCTFSNSSAYECGQVSDNCGGVIDLVSDCGSAGCGGGEVCMEGMFGFLVCDPAPCTPMTCGDFPSVDCGLVQDGCGGLIDMQSDCGRPACSAPEVCGGGQGGPNQCGDPGCPFPRRTCADYQDLIAGAGAGPLCGALADGCGGTLDLVTDCGAPGCGSCVPGTPIATQCDVYPTPANPEDSRICLENASGCPGEVVDVQVHVIVPATCGGNGTSQRSFSLGLQGFEVLNDRTDSCGVERCINRSIFTDELSWIQFPGGAIGCSETQCPSVLEGGFIDMAQLRIPPGQASGDVVLSVLSSPSSMILQPCGCMSCDVIDVAGISPTIRVY